VGDNIHTDVAGAKGVGITAVWLNRDGASRPEGSVEPDYEIASLSELHEIVKSIEGREAEAGRPLL
jgi:putative hydrolase of the HAD superfamily